MANTTRGKCQREGVFVPPALTSSVCTAAVVNNIDHNSRSTTAGTVSAGQVCNWYNSQTERGQTLPLFHSVTGSVNQSINQSVTQSINQTVFVWLKSIVSFECIK